MEYNLLIMSDLHIAAKAALERNKEVKKSASFQLPALLHYYSEHRLYEMPWRLVVAGDFLDFTGVVETPSEKELEEAGIKPSMDRRKFGLRETPWESTWKLRRLVEDNPDVFKALARFIMKGNELFIVSGNHDVYFIWTDVRKALLEKLAESARDLGHERDTAVREINSRVQFNPWFYYEPGELWVEHGHQFDPYNSFLYVLAPFHARKNETAPAVGLMAQRYFSNRVAGLNPYAENIGGFFEYLRWMLRSQKINTIRVMWYYLESATLGIMRSGRLRSRGLLGVQLGEEERLEQKTGAPRKVLRKIRRMHKPPIARSPLLTASMVHMDKTLVTFVYVFLLFLLLKADHSIAGKALGALLLLTSNYGLVTLMSKRKGRMERRGFFRTAARVARTAGVRNVVMGHLHEPYMGSMGESVRVYGLGAWTSSHGGVHTSLYHAVVPSYVMATGPAGNRRLIMYSWDQRNERPIQGRELSRMEILAA